MVPAKLYWSLYHKNQKLQKDYDILLKIINNNENIPREIKIDHKKTKLSHQISEIIICKESHLDEDKNKY
tara:strand:- start:496 stop:705 length:210 start_codon:yes stop_codon:yes gene_type:complete